MDHTLRRLSEAPACFISNNCILIGKDDQPIRPLEICYACEKVTGKGSIEGVQKMNGLWRIYPMNLKAYNELTVKGIGLRGQMVEVLRRNPTLLTNDKGNPTTRLTIGNVFLSTANSEIENALDKAGVVRRSPLRFECLRDKDGGLTSFKSGRRFVFIDIPPSPLPSYTLLGKRKMFLFHQEQVSRERGREEREILEKVSSSPVDKVREEQIPQTSEGSEDTPFDNKTPSQTIGGDNVSNKQVISSQSPVQTRVQMTKPAKTSIDVFLSRRARSSSVGRKSPMGRSLSRTKRGRTADQLSQVEKAARLEREENSSAKTVDWFSDPEVQNITR